MAVGRTHHLTICISSILQPSLLSGAVGNIALASVGCPAGIGLLYYCNSMLACYDNSLGWVDLVEGGWSGLRARIGFWHSMALASMPPPAQHWRWYNQLLLWLCQFSIAVAVLVLCSLAERVLVKDQPCARHFLFCGNLAACFCVAFLVSPFSVSSMECQQL